MKKQLKEAQKAEEDLINQLIPLKVRTYYFGMNSLNLNYAIDVIYVMQAEHILMNYETF